MLKDPVSGGGNESSSKARTLAAGAGSLGVMKAELHDCFDRKPYSVPLISTGQAQDSLRRKLGQRASSRCCSVEGGCWRPATSGASQAHFMIPPCPPP